MPKQVSTIVVASGNQGKVEEFAEYFGALGIQVKSLKDYAPMPPVIEDGDSFYANALKKAKVTAEKLGIAVLADDSGLEVDLLNGEPGIYSARYAGDRASDERNNQKLIQRLKMKASSAKAEITAEKDPDRLSLARFVCELVLYDPNKNEPIHARGEWEGVIIEHPRGKQGFGYDPHFYLPELGLTAAELSPELKNRISHRGKALQKLIRHLN